MGTSGAWFSPGAVPVSRSESLGNSHQIMTEHSWRSSTSVSLPLRWDSSEMYSPGSPGISAGSSGTLCFAVLSFLASFPHSPCRISSHPSLDKLSSEFASGDTHTRALTPQALGRREGGMKQRVRHAILVRGRYSCRTPNQNVDVEEGTGRSLLH